MGESFIDAPEIYQVSSLGSPRSQFGFHNAPGFHQLRRADRGQKHEKLKRLREDRCPDRIEASSAPNSLRNHSHAREYLQRLAKGGAAHSDPFGQLALGGQTVSREKGPIPDELLEIDEE
jgi:hypothetical protein